MSRNADAVVGASTEGALPESWMKRPMKALDVFEAFVRREAAEAHEVRSFGDKLYSRDVLIAQWTAQGLTIQSDPAGPCEELHKDTLTELLLVRMRQAEVLRDLVSNFNGLPADEAQQQTAPPEKGETGDG